jgi:hypothetical protein
MKWNPSKPSMIGTHIFVQNRTYFSYIYDKSSEWVIVV